MASTNAWSPAPGRHRVNIGSSLVRALKARKGDPPPQKRSNLPDRDFYALRYNFKPSSIDPTKSGNMEVKRNKDGPSTLIVEHPAQPSGLHVYRGREDPAKEWACVLIFDEETGSYTLEKIESFVSLEHIERRPQSLTAVSQPATPSINERSPPHVIESQDNEADRAFEEILPEELVGPSRQTKNEPDSEEDISLQHTVPSRPQPAAQLAAPRTKKSTSSKIKSKARHAHVEPPIHSLPMSTPPVHSTKVRKASKRQTPEFSDVEEELLDFAGPSKRTRSSPPPPQPTPISRPPQPKRAPVRKQPSPPPPRPRAALELPGSSSSFVPPPPIPLSSASRQPPTSVIPPVPLAPATSAIEPPTQAPAAASDSEEDIEWDEVAAPDGVSHNIMMIEETGENENDGGEEIDVDEFEDLMNQHLEEGTGKGEEDDDGFNIFPDSPEPQSQELLPMPSLPRSGGGPISLNAFATGGDHEDDEEYSSSEESDDE
ncbi:hypothetical protein E1B28_003966 [Marasmius oreades]|uniref:Transcription elongation factor Eaf N-terminal domain-containing protein n=1 Tax=Marasmius oreades TaxID=181124 RepID=A0A9P8AC20_9AGAR|nr:uncharacterized protein E1B28_003966 [Marasmius oreades]KAG7096539.1 hypothetical protein E1B28_003966 [Marasmius oreades]